MNTFEPNKRWGVEYKVKGGRWTLLFTVGSELLANRMLAAVCGTSSGDWRIRRPERRVA